MWAVVAWLSEYTCSTSARLAASRPIDVRACMIVHTWSHHPRRSWARTPVWSWPNIDCRPCRQQSRAPLVCCRGVLVFPFIFCHLLYIAATSISAAVAIATHSSVWSKHVVEHKVPHCTHLPRHLSIATDRWKRLDKPHRHCSHHRARARWHRHVV